jgi:hypothetical protein
MRHDIPASYKGLALGDQVLDTTGVRLMQERLSNGWPLLTVLSGGTGSGKSVAAAWAAVRSGPYFAYLSLSRIEEQDQDDEWKRWLRMPLLIVDDCDQAIGSRAPGVHDKIRALIEARTSLGRPTLCTAYGLTADQFTALYLSSETVVRLRDTSWWHELPETSLRSTEALSHMRKVLALVEDTIP